MKKRYVNLQEITVKEPLKVDTEFSDKMLSLPKEEVVASSPFKLYIEISKRAVGYNAKGDVRGSLTLRCGRCDREFFKRLNIEFSYDIMPTSEITEGRINKAELDVKFSDEDVLDLLDVVREQIFLNLPFKPLCDDNCKGIECGEIENTENVDDRWNKLKELKEKLERKEK